MKRRKLNFTNKKKIYILKRKISHHKTNESKTTESRNTGEQKKISIEKKLAETKCMDLPSALENVAVLRRASLDFINFPFCDLMR